MGLYYPVARKEKRVAATDETDPLCARTKGIHSLARCETAATALASSISPAVTLTAAATPPCTADVPACNAKQLVHYVCLSTSYMMVQTPRAAAERN